MSAVGVAFATASIIVTATTYSPTRVHCDRTPNMLADGSLIDAAQAPHEAPIRVPTEPRERVVALSRDLLKRFNPQGSFDYGDCILVAGTGDLDGVWVVRDSMNHRWVRRVDFLVPGGVKGRWDGVVVSAIPAEKKRMLTWSDAPPRAFDQSGGQRFLGAVEEQPPQTNSRMGLVLCLSSWIFVWIFVAHKKRFETREETNFRFRV